MSTAATQFSPCRWLIAAALVVVFCAGSAMVLVGWTPGASGLPAGVGKVES